MARVLADLNIAEVIAESHSRDYPGDSARLLLKQSIFARNGVTPEEVDTSLRWYGYHMDKYLEVYDRAIEMVESDIAATTERAGAAREKDTNVQSVYDTEGDSVDLWRGLRTRTYSPGMPSSFTTFHTVTDRNWQRGDIFTLSLRASGSPAPVTLTLAVDYQDGQHEYVTSTVSTSGWTHLSLPLDSARIASQVYGLIHAATMPGQTLVTDSLSLVRTRRLASWKERRSNVQEFSGGYNR